MSKKDLQKNFAHSKHDGTTEGDIVRHPNSQQLKKKFYEDELSKVQAELVKMKYWVKAMDIGLSSFLKVVTQQAKVVPSND